MKVPRIISDGTSVMTGKENEVAAKSKKLPVWKYAEHALYHHSALFCIDAGDHMQFITDFETTMVQLWAFLKNLPTQLKSYIKIT